LGAHKDAKGDLELLVYGKSSEPVMRLPLKAISADQDLPIDITGERKSDGLGLVTLKFFGKYEASIELRRTSQ
jgi:hypothetical protein